MRFNEGNDMHSFMYARELGFSCIPVINATGRPADNIEWKQFVYSLPSKDLCDVWDFKYKIGDEFGIAVIAGPASGLSWIDIDTSNVATHAACPKSPYGKSGRPGYATYFFKYNDSFKDILNTVESKNGKQVAICLHSRYTIFDPSLRRPDEKNNNIVHKYRPIGKSLWDLEDRNDLPELTNFKFHDELPVIDQTKYIETNSGRNNKLKSIVTAMYSRGKSDVEIAKEILDYDLSAHDKPLFKDKDEGNEAHSEQEMFLNARRFASSIVGSLIKTNIEVTFNNDEFSIEEDSYIFKPRKYPAPFPGLIESFVSVAKTSANVVNESAFLGAALSLISILARHRVHYKNLQPNLFVLGIADSGEGKTDTLKLLKQCLEPLNLAREGSYKSGAAFLEVARQRPLLLHIIDEASSLFASMKSTNSYNSDLMDMINGMMTATNSIYNAPITKDTAKEPRPIEYPYFSMLAFTHEAGFKSHCNEYMGESGLLGRMTVLNDRSYGDVINSDTSKVDGLVSLVSSFDRTLQSLYPIKKQYRSNFLIDVSPPYDVTEVSASKQVSDYIFNYRVDKKKIARLEESESKKAVLNRHAEKLIKYATLAFLSELQSEVIEMRHFDWAIELVESEYHNLTPFFELLSVDGDWYSKYRSKLLSVLTTKGPVGEKKIQQRLKLDDFRFKKIKDSLISTGEIGSRNHHQGTTLYARRLDS